MHWALGDAYRLMGDVYLAHGELDAAEQSFHFAYQHSWDPYPGYAELLYPRGRGEEAVRGLERAASQTNWVAAERRARYLAHAAQFAALSGQQEKARDLLHHLDEEPQRGEAGVVAGQVDCARAELAWSEGSTASTASRPYLIAAQRCSHGGDPGSSAISGTVSAARRPRSCSHGIECC